MKFQTHDKTINASISQLIVAGWTGRNSDAVQHHIAELAEIGIKPPSSVPLFYQVSAQLLTHAPSIQVLGKHTSGEVEPLVINIDDQWWLGLASDHTDRELEAYSIAASKQACAKPLASTLWPLESLEDRMDDLILKCEIKDDNTPWSTYQEGTLASILPIKELMQAASLKTNSAMLCGTLGAIGPIRPAQHYRMSLEDAQLNRTLELAYSVTVLDVIS